MTREQRVAAIIEKLGLSIAGEDKRVALEVLAVFARVTCEQFGVPPEEFIALFKSSGPITPDRLGSGN